MSDPTVKVKDCKSIAAAELLDKFPVLKLLVKVSVSDPVNSNPDIVIPSAIPIDLVLLVVKFNIEFDPKASA